PYWARTAAAEFPRSKAQLRSWSRTYLVSVPPRCAGDGPGLHCCRATVDWRHAPVASCRRLSCSASLRLSPVSCRTCLMLPVSEQNSFSAIWGSHSHAVRSQSQTAPCSGAGNPWRGFLLGRLGGFRSSELADTGVARRGRGDWLPPEPERRARFEARLHRVHRRDRGGGHRRLSRSEPG